MRTPYLVFEPTPISSQYSCTHNQHLVLHGRSPPLLGLIVGRLGLVDALVEDLGVLVLYLFVSRGLA